MREHRWKRRGFDRLRSALRHQFDGIRHALRHDAAIRQVSLVCGALSLVALCLPIPAMSRVQLVSATLMVVVAEYLNSAIEAAVDRISLDAHPLSKQAKDLGSVAVGLTALIALVSWAAVLLHMAGVWP